MKVIDSSGIKKKAASPMWNINVSLLDTVRGYEVNASSIKLHKNI
jgi:hypothetical protein